MSTARAKRTKEKTKEKKREQEKKTVLVKIRWRDYGDESFNKKLISMLVYYKNRGLVFVKFRKPISYRKFEKHCEFVGHEDWISFPPPPTEVYECQEDYIEKILSTRNAVIY